MMDAVKVKKPIDEEAHFRLDEHTRDLEGIKKALHPDNVAAVATGAMATMSAQLERRLQENLDRVCGDLVKAVRDDSKSDAAVTQALLKLCEQLGAHHEELLEHSRGIAKCADTLAKCSEQLAKHTGLLAAAKSTDLSELKGLSTELRSLCGLLSKPTTRTAVLDLPGGPATMTVRESRQ